MTGIGQYTYIWRMQSAKGYPIKVVVQRTGLSPHVLRVWERRYQAVVPSRTATNRRLYTEADIEQLQLLHRATRGGHSIGQIAQLSTAELEALVRADEAAVQFRPSSPALPSSAASSFDPESCLERCLDAVRSFDAATLENELARAAIELSQPRLVEEIVKPLMHHIGDLWEDGSLRIADEHLTSAVVRTFVGSLKDAYQGPASGPGLVVTTPAGQLHELGALLVATTAASAGWRVTYLGPNLPAEEIAAAARQDQARAVALSIVYPADDPHLGSELVKLRRYLDAAVVLLVGGRAAPAYQSFLDQSNALYLDTLAALRTQLEALRAAPQSS